MHNPPPAGQSLSPLRRLLTRRRFIRNAAIASGGLVVTYSALKRDLVTPTLASDGTAEDFDSLVGKIARIELPDRVELNAYGEQGSKAAVVALRPDALVGRSTPASLDIFVVGEEVVAEGDWDDDVFWSSLFTNVYRYLEGHVEAVDADSRTIRVDGGDFRVAADVVLIQGQEVPIGSDLDEYLTNAHVSVTYRVDPGGLPVAAMIALEHGHAV